MSNQAGTEFVAFGAAQVVPALGGVLNNDTDADGNPITVIAVNGSGSNVGVPTATAQGGTVTLNANGTLTYTAAANFSGTDTFTYVASDGSLSDTATVTINVTPVNDAPVLADTVVALAAETEDAGAPSGAVGTLVNTLVAGVSDVDVGALQGIAVTAADTTQGTWWYSTNNGTNWNALGAVSNASARLLAADANTRIYFEPTTLNWNGTLPAAITFRAWDRTSGANGGTVDTSTNGGTSAFSTPTDTASLLVNPINDPPTITSNGAGATASVNAAENQTAVTDVDAADPDVPTTITYSLAGGADQALFTIDATTGVLSFLAAPNFEAPADADTNGIYEVTVRAADGALFDDQAISVTVTNVNEAPSITSNGAGATASVNAAENQTAVTDVDAADPDVPTTITYSLAGGADQALFTIDATTGVLSFLAAPNFEAPADADTNGIYDVTVRAADGALFDDQAISRHRHQRQRSPEHHLQRRRGHRERQRRGEPDRGHRRRCRRPRCAHHDHLLPRRRRRPGPVHDRCHHRACSRSSPRPISRPRPMPAPTAVYDVTVRAADGALFDDQAITVTVTNVNESPDASPPTAPGPPRASNAAENQTAVTDVDAADPDVPTTITYSLAGGADQALFTIDAHHRRARLPRRPRLRGPGRCRHQQRLRRHRARRRRRAVR